MDDLISRQAAIDEFLTELTKRERTRLLHLWSTVEVKYFIAKILEQMPPTQQWIPCKTALPDKGKYVLCQCRAGIMDVLRLTDDNGWYKDSTHIYMHGFVVAWMPLPEPWKGGQDGRPD